MIAKLDELQKQKASLERKIGLINQLKSQQDLAVRIMDELSRSLPDWVWLNEVSYRFEEASRSGATPSPTTSSPTSSPTWRTAPISTNVNLISSTQRTAENDQFLDFSLTAGVVNPEQPARRRRLPPADSRSTRRTP